ncbi:hypothetical protein [Streptomyces tateyamensis]|uniref:hypothetical protein n=1 Tax=Streptomyces tateyamensis TaxID=565073 RepID=UPI0015E87985|nr:hypothetical protein [Streptomyces tateyamensis]
MGEMYGKAHLRPIKGGIEWTTDPACLQAVADAPTLQPVARRSKPRNEAAISLPDVHGG